MAGWLRRAVARATAPDRLVRRSGLLLRDRVVATQAELLEIADLLERAERPDAENVEVDAAALCPDASELKAR